jgi:tryptophanyl-tRNA synthetase
LIPAEAIIQKDTMLVPGIDGTKMSKSKNNTINIFQPDKKLKKEVMSIITDSTPLEEPKNPDTCNVFALYKLLATESEIETMRQNYLGGNYGYGHAKTALYEKILSHFAETRAKYFELMENKQIIENHLMQGATKARKVARDVLGRVREKVGFTAPQPPLP